MDQQSHSDLTPRIIFYDLPAKNDYVSLYSWKQRIRKPLALQKGLLPNIWVILFFSTDTIISDYPFLCCTGGFVLFAEVLLF